MSHTRMNQFQAYGSGHPESSLLDWHGLQAQGLHHKTQCGSTPSTSTIFRREKRIKKACDNCRERKRRCNGKIKCDQCIHTECTYLYTRKKKGDSRQRNSSSSRKPSDSCHLITNSIETGDTFESFKETPTHAKTQASPFSSIPATNAGLGVELQPLENQFLAMQMNNEFGFNDIGAELDGFSLNSLPTLISTSSILCNKESESAVLLWQEPDGTPFLCYSI
ncbi:hypothetical protein BS50DRAFT_627015 [Corynespora cassiicola Philippines]|uniref:Zn(2)-C6 fungal-type domain-containing protein n=1 Tax=Corynespora cassiicola Philippines TaxID=1448308 RepID=A0A2T2N0A7_CORCC|nr:hypothetical protein BS50DRAFT_627015 [Corynespora cassiicola Philippines]